MTNQKIAEIFQEVGDILEIQGDNPYHYLAYQRAAQRIGSYPKDVYDLYRKDPKLIDDIPGIGEGLMQKIIEIIETGDCKYHKTLVKNFEPGLLEMLRIRGVGPKKVKLFWNSFGIDSVAKLKRAAQDKILQTLPRMGEKSEAEILVSIEEMTYLQERTSIAIALPIAEDIVDYMKRSKFVEKAQYAGSLRRRAETVGDIDILTIGKEHKKILDRFTDYPEVEKVLVKGGTKASVVLKDGLQVDMRVVDKKSFGAALYYFTGSKYHNVATRKLAIKKGLKVNEYGIFKGKKVVAGKTEEEIFKKLGLPYIEPEMRENLGEIEIGMKKKKMPKLVELKDLKGDLHMHTTASDGMGSIEAMAKSAKSFGFDYIAITDHSKSTSIANGLDHKDVVKHMKAIEKADKKVDGIKILKGTECDIMKDGSLDYDEKTLKLFDIVNISVHRYFKLDREEQTARLIRAMENPYTNIWSHPSARLIGERKAIEYDIEKVLKAAKANKVAIEINAQPKRLDLKDIHIKLAKDLGCKFVINTDSHVVDNWPMLQFGINNARRGWLTKNDVLNAQPLEKLLAYFK